MQPLSTFNPILWPWHLKRLPYFFWKTKNPVFLMLILYLVIIGFNLTNMPADIRPKIAYENLRTKNCERKIAYENCAFGVLHVHMYAFCMFISYLFSSGMKLGVRKFRVLIAFGFHCLPKVSSILYL